MNKQQSFGLARWILTAVILITVVCKVVPLAVLMPSVGLDESWRFAMNQVIAERMPLGRDIVFTFGPYAFLYTKLYHPLIDRLAMASSIYLAASYVFVLFGVLRGSSASAARLACFCLALLMPLLVDNIFICTSCWQAFSAVPSPTAMSEDGAQRIGWRHASSLHSSRLA